MLYIIKQGLISQLRQRKWVIFNALFPIFLMLLIGTMLASFEGDYSTTEVAFINNTSKETSEILNIFEENSEEINVKLTEITDLEVGKEEVRNNRNILIDFEKDTVKVYFSEANARGGAKVLATLQGIGKGYAAVTEMYSINPEKATEVLRDSAFFEEVKVELVPKENAPNSYQYYGVVETTMMVFYIALFPIGILSYDKRNKMKERINLAGITNWSYFMGRIISSWILSIIVLIPGFLFSIYQLNTKWGDNPLITFVYVSIFGLMMATTGALIGYIAKEHEKATVILQGIVIPALSFLGGAYLSLPQNIPGIFGMITNLSPLRWLNKGIFELAYKGDWKILNTSLIINLSITAILILIFIVAYKREERNA